MIITRSAAVAAAQVERLTQAKSAARSAVNDIIGNKRGSFITVLPGQEMIYLAKEDEARDFVADPDPDLVDYPLISAEIGLTASSAYEVAQVILGLGAIWRQIAAELEGLRYTALAAVDEATTTFEVESVVSNLRDTLATIYSQ